MFILLLLLVLALVYYYLTRNLNYWKKRNVPGPEPKFFIGNFSSIYDRKIHMGTQFHEIYQAYKGKTSVVGIFRGISPDLLMLDPELVKQVLITKFSHFVNQHSFIAVSKDSDPIVGRNPFWLRDDEWRESRGSIVPAFTSARVKANWPGMQVVYNRMSEHIKQKMNEDGFLDIRSVCVKYTTDVVSSALYGVESGAFTGTVSEILTLSQNVLLPNWRLTILLALAPVFPAVAKIFKVRLMAEREANFMAQLLRDTMKYRKENNIERQDFIDYLIHLREKKGLDEFDLVAHTASFFFDGIETSSIVLSHTFYELAKNKTIQDKLRAEVMAIKGAQGFEYDTLVELKYLDQVVFEAMRLHPILATHARECNDKLDIQLPDGGTLHIPEKMNVWIPTLGIQKDPEFYPQPDAFLPERFDEKGVKWYRDQCLLLPFGEGPRTCLGQKFGLAQVKCCIASTIANFEICVDPKTVPTMTPNPDEINWAYKERFYLNFRMLQ